MTGEFALRAAGIRLPKQGFVFGDPINEILFEGGEDRATLWQIIETTASALGLPREDLPDAREIFGRIAAAAAAIMQDRGDGIVFPPLSIPDEHYPAEWSPNACSGSRSRARRKRRRAGAAPRARLPSHGQRGAGGRNEGLGGTSTLRRRTRGREGDAWAEFGRNMVNVRITRPAYRPTCPAESNRRCPAGSRHLTQGHRALAADRTSSA